MAVWFSLKESFPMNKRLFIDGPSLWVFNKKLQELTGNRKSNINLSILKRATNADSAVCYCEGNENHPGTIGFINQLDEANIQHVLSKPKSDEWLVKMMTDICDESMSHNEQEIAIFTQNRNLLYFAQRFSFRIYYPKGLADSLFDMEVQEQRLSDQQLNYTEIATL